MIAIHYVQNFLNIMVVIDVKSIESISFQTMYVYFKPAGHEFSPMSENVRHETSLGFPSEIMYGAARSTDYSSTK